MAVYPTDGASPGTWGAECRDYHTVSTDLATGKIKNEALQVASTAPIADAALVNKKYVDDLLPISVPSATNGEVSVAGLELKWGEESVAGNTTDTFTFASKGLSAFSNNILNTQASYKDTGATLDNPCTVTENGITGIKVTNGDASTRTVSWFAIGR